MSHATLWDHLFVLVMFIALPLYSWRSVPGFVRDVRERGEPAKVAGYRETIAIWFAAAVALAISWSALDRDWADLGLRSTEPWHLAAGLGVALVFFVGMVGQLRRVPAEGPALDEVLGPLGDLIVLIPRTHREERWFHALSLNAGITEELIFRGFLFWYLEPVAGTFGAAVLMVLAFTAAHAYQGLAQLPGMALGSTVLVSLYLLTGSLLVPIILHVVFDAAQGRVLARLLRARNA